jgi:hypothetical protein
MGGNASMLRFEVCCGKAYGALALGRPSELVLQKAREKPLFMQSLERLADYPLFLEGGGQLIRDKSGEVLGAVGVTGDANELDDLCAIAGIHAAKLCADSDFFDDPDLVRSLSIHKSAPLVDPRPRLEPFRFDPLPSTCNPSGRDFTPWRKPSRQTGAVIFAEGACRGDDLKRNHSGRKYGPKPPIGEGGSA